MISVQDRIPATVAITKIRAVRGTSNEVVGPSKSGRIRWLTLGPTTATLWWEPVIRWRQRSDIGDRFGPWLFPARTRPHDSADTSSLGHWFAVLCSEAGHPDVTPHRLSHTVATTSEPRGDIVKAQYRLPNTGSGTATPPTTLCIYGHVMPLTDDDAAATLDQLYRPPDAT